MTTIGFGNNTGGIGQVLCHYWARLSTKISVLPGLWGTGKQKDVNSYMFIKSVDPKGWLRTNHFTVVYVKSGQVTADLLKFPNGFQGKWLSKGGGLPFSSFAQSSLAVFHSNTDPAQVSCFPLLRDSGPRLPPVGHHSFFQWEFSWVHLLQMPVENVGCDIPGTLAHRSPCCKNISKFWVSPPPSESQLSESSSPKRFSSDCWCLWAVLTPFFFFFLPLWSASETDQGKEVLRLDDGMLRLGSNGQARWIWCRGTGIYDTQGVEDFFPPQQALFAPTFTFAAYEQRCL